MTSEVRSQMTIALERAIEAHKDQKYGKLPYIAHLAQVDNLVVQIYKPKGLGPSDPYSKEPGDEMDCLRAIAFLHDILEDTDLSTLDLHIAGVNDTVINAVVAMTKWDGVSYNQYIQNVKENGLALKVKLCDTSANLMNSCSEGNTKRINKYTKQIQLLGGF